MNNLRFAISSQSDKKEAAMYFNGDRIVEETARVIQSRLSIYVAEQKKFE